MLASRSSSTVTLWLLGLTCQLDLSRLMASRPCNRLAAQLWGASDAALVEGTSGPGTDLGSAVQAAAPQTLTATPSDSSGSLVGIQIAQVMGASRHFLTPGNVYRQAPRWGPKSSLRCTTTSVGTCRGEGVACGALRHSSVSQKERHLAQRPGHHFRSSAGRDLRSAGGGQGSRFALSADAQQAFHGRQATAAAHALRHRPCWTSLACSIEHLADRAARLLPAVLFSRAHLEAPCSYWYFTFNVNALFRLGRLRLVLQYLNHYSLHAAGLQGTRPSGDRAKLTSPLDFFDASSPRYHVLHWV